MGKSFLERLARGLGKSTGKLVEKAQAKLKDLVKEYEDGQNEGREEREAASDKDGEPTPGGESSAEEVSAGESSEVDDREPASSAGNVSEDGDSGGAVDTDEDRRGDEPTGESGGARDT